MDIEPTRAQPELILGTAVGLDAGQVLPFLISLARTGYEGNTALFVDRRLRRELRGADLPRNLTLIPILQWLPFKLGFWNHRRVMAGLWRPLQTLALTMLGAIEGAVPAWRGLARLRSSVACLLYPPMDTRFIRYERFLRNHRHERILLTDVRDVLFQSDPFAGLPHARLALSLETPAYRIATESHNAAWIRRVYGDELLERIGSERVSCVGVTYGEQSGVLHYLDGFTRELMRLAPRAIGAGGADTAIHNKLLWSDQLGAVELLEPLSSPIVNLNAIDDADLALSDEGRLLDRDGTEISVIHQYDRQPQLVQRLMDAVCGPPRPA